MTNTATSKRARQIAKKPAIDPKLDSKASATAGEHGALTPEPAPAAAAATGSATKPETKSARVVALLQRKEGATLEEMVTATGWLPHTTRAALTGLKRKGHTITSVKADGIRRYCAKTSGAVAQ